MRAGPTLGPPRSILALSSPVALSKLARTGVAAAIQASHRGPPPAMTFPRSILHVQAVPAPSPNPFRLAALALAGAVGAIFGQSPVVRNAAAAQEKSAAVRPIEFNTHVLPNGLKLWHGLMPGARQCGIMMIVHVGSLGNPAGAPDLAHLLEHVLLGERNGREQHDEIETRGGVALGQTSLTGTTYPITIPSEHAGFALEWLARVLVPRALDPHLIRVERERIDLELAAPAPRLADWFEQIASPAYERRRADGRDRRTVGRPALEAFHLAHYVPRNMTLVVMGDIALDEVRAAAERAFGGWVDRAPPGPGPGEFQPMPRRVRHRWESAAELKFGWKLPVRRAEDPMRHVFLSLWLELRLQEQLLWDSERPVYGSPVRLHQRPVESHLVVSATATPAKLDLVRRVLEREVARIAEGKIDDAEFARDRDEILASFAWRFASPQAMVRGWLRLDALPMLHRDFPDPRLIFRDLRREDVVAAIGPALAPSHTELTVTRVNPIGPAAHVVVCGAVFAATLAGAWRCVRRWARPGPPAFRGWAGAGMTGLLCAVLALAAAFAVPRAQEALAGTASRYEAFWPFLLAQYLPFAGLGGLVALLLVFRSRRPIAAPALGTPPPPSGVTAPGRSG